MDAHYEAMRVMRKPRSTKNPYYPRGTHRRWQLYAESPSLGLPLTEEDVADACELSTLYWEVNRPSSARKRAWEIDPVVSALGRQERDARVSAHVLCSLEVQYEAYRAATMELAGT